MLRTVMSIRSFSPAPKLSGMAIWPSMFRGNRFPAIHAPAAITAAHRNPFSTFAVYSPFIFIDGIRIKLNSTTPTTPSTIGRITDIAFFSIFFSIVCA